MEGRRAVTSPCQLNSTRRMHRSRYSDRFHYLQSTESRSLTPIYLNRRLNGRWRGQGRWRAVGGYISVVSAESVWNWCSATNWIIITDPFRPGKLKNTSGPFRCGICRSTFNSLAECLGCGAEEGMNRVKMGNHSCVHPFIATHPFALKGLHGAKQQLQLLHRDTVAGQNAQHFD